MLSACAGGSGNTGSRGELKTASDQTADEKRAAIRLQLAVGYYQDGKYEVALDEIKQAIAADPDYGRRLRRARPDLHGDGRDARWPTRTYQRALQLAPRNPELANNYGSFLCQNGKPAQGMR